MINNGKEQRSLEFITILFIRKEGLIIMETIRMKMEIINLEISSLKKTMKNKKGIEKVRK
jgi:hypothetical protein